MHIRKTIALTMTAASLLGIACAKSPTGRPQLLLVSNSEMDKMGLAAWSEIKSETPQSRDPNLVAYVRCVSAAVTKEEAPDQNWEVALFQSPEVNAFALPGGRIGVYTGILEVAENQDQLAAIIGHEVAHVVAQHGNARVSAAMATEAGLNLASAVIGNHSKANNQLLGLLGVGAQFGVLMPYGRDQESEADIIGLEYMSKAGFDPQGAVALWENMKSVGGQSPPEFLSTHPSHDTRIQDLAARVPAARQLMASAQGAGRSPRCQRPGAPSAAVSRPGT